jgi:hypothetical protein
MIWGHRRGPGGSSTRPFFVSSLRLVDVSHLASSSRLVDLLIATRHRGASDREISPGVPEPKVASIAIKAVEEEGVAIEAVAIEAVAIEAVEAVEGAKVGDAYLVLGVAGVGITSNPCTLVCVITCIDDLEGLSDISAVCLLLKVAEAIIEAIIEGVEAIEVAVEEVAEVIVVVVEALEAVVVKAIEVADEVVVVVVVLVVIIAVVVSLGHGGGGGHHQDGQR